MANVFNSYFTDIIQTNESLLHDSQTPINITKPFELTRCSTEEVENTIISLNSNSANGIDDISTKFIKRYSPILAKPISGFINKYNFNQSTKRGAKKTVITTDR